MIDIGPMPPWGWPATAAAAAERAKAVFILTGSKSSVATYAEVLDRLWVELSSGGAALGPLRDRIEGLGEAKYRDPEGKRYLASAALGVLATALEVALGRAGRIDVVDEASGLFSEFDGLGQGPQIIDPRNPPPPGPMEEAELARIRFDAEEIQAAVDRDEELEGLRMRSVGQAMDLAQILPRLVAEYIRD